MLFIIAGNYEQARQYAKKNNISSSEFRYISNARSVLGYRITNYIKTGTWYERHDIELIERAIDESTRF